MLRALLLSLALIAQYTVYSIHSIDNPSSCVLTAHMTITISLSLFNTLVSMDLRQRALLRSLTLEPSLISLFVPFVTHNKVLLRGEC
jgi:hypothetical protein